MGRLIIFRGIGRRRSRGTSLGRTEIDSNKWFFPADRRARDRRRNRRRSRSGATVGTEHAGPHRDSTTTPSTRPLTLPVPATELTE